MDRRQVPQDSMFFAGDLIMAVPEPLRNNPFRFRKRISLNSLLDEDYSGPVRPAEEAHRGLIVPRQSTTRPRCYMADLSEDYMPELDAMSMPDDGYEPYDGLSFPAIHRFNVPAGQARLPPLSKQDVRYEDCLMDEDMFQHQLRLILQQFKEALPQPVDNNAMLNEALKKARSAERPDVLEDIFRRLLTLQDGLNGRTIDGITDNEEQSEPEAATALPDLPYRAAEPAHIELRPDNYLNPIPEDFFDTQAQLMEKQFSQPDASGVDISEQMDGVFNAQEALFNMLQGQMPSVEEAISDQMADVSFPEQGLADVSLEQIVEAFEMQGPAVAPDMIGITPSYDDCLMDSALFEQQVHEAAGQMESVESLPDQMYEPNDMMLPYDPQIQQMMDPYMMPGPMGPGPMMGPGPGGP
jgi:hypothetical protein